jgi:hypothetical protein
MMKLGELVNYKSWAALHDIKRLGVVIDTHHEKPIQNLSCFDGPTGETRVRIAFCDGSGIKWVNASELKREKK